MPPCIPLINTLRQNLAISLGDHFVDSDNLFSFSVYEYSEDKIAAGLSCDVQSNPAISNSVNSKSPLFRRKIEFPWIYPSPLRFPGYFKTPLFRTFFHFPWDFEIAGFDCICK